MDVRSKRGDPLNVGSAQKNQLQKCMYFIEHKECIQTCFQEGYKDCSPTGPWLGDGQGALSGEEESKGASSSTNWGEESDNPTRLLRANVDK